MKRLLGLLALVLGLVGCEFPDQVTNGDLDAWCGDAPCDWEVDGTIKRVSTWHENDYAASFESDGARLHQLNAELSGYECLSFSMIASVSRRELGWVELDFLGDGSVDWDSPIPPGGFRRLEFSVRAPDRYEGVRFIVRKQGEGEMVLARLSATLGGECNGDQVMLTNLPGGSPCETDDNCATKTCVAGYCIGCERDADCEGGEVCGYESVGTVSVLNSVGFGLNVLPQCIEPATRSIGQLCLGDGECESGVCCEGACSQCCDGAGCEGELACERTDDGDGEGTGVREPFLCAPDANRGHSGDPCTQGGDCRSGRCVDIDCTGLCIPFEHEDLVERCAMLECDEASCDDLDCGVETVEVGRCE